MTTILIVDDDKEIAKLSEFYLLNEGYQVLKAYDGEMALQMIHKHEIELLVLDVMMPKLNGLEVCREIRKDKDLPILMVSAKVEDIDKIIGLTTGADDYMEKPFNPLELVARVKALLRRSRMQNSHIVQSKNELFIHSLAINKTYHTVKVDGNILSLTPIEFNILYLLASNIGQVFSSEKIFEHIWNENGQGANKTVMVHVSNLREKLEKVTGGEKIIQTVWGVGYKIDN